MSAHNLELTFALLEVGQSNVRIGTAIVAALGDRH